MFLKWLWFIPYNYLWTGTVSGTKDVKRVFVLRGLPGMGKTYLAKTLAFSISPDQKSIICSADDYFMVNGEYKWFWEGLADAHDECYSKFFKALKDGVDLVIVDNVNSKKADFEIYKQRAAIEDYWFTEITVGDLDVDKSFSRNHHSVPRATLEAIAASWER